MYVVHFKRRSAILTLAGVVLAAVLLAIRRDAPVRA